MNIFGKGIMQNFNIINTHVRKQIIGAAFTRVCLRHARRRYLYGERASFDRKTLIRLGVSGIRMLCFHEVFDVVWRGSVLTVLLNDNNIFFALRLHFLESEIQQHIVKGGPFFI